MMTQRSTLKVKVIGHRSKVKVRNRGFRSHCILTGNDIKVKVTWVKVRSLGSRSKVTWVKVKGHFGQGQANSRDIGRRAHISVKLHFYFMEKC